jgi:hypothetical protein
MDKKLEYVKFEERLDFALALLKKKFNGFEGNAPLEAQIALLHEACEIARTLFVRSEIQYSGR